MNYKELDKVKGSHWIFSNRDYVVFVGKKLWIFKKDGTLIACRADIPHAYKVAFLPEERLLTGGGNKAAYRLLSLVDGTDIWSIPPIKKKEVCAERFAISSDYMLAFDYYKWKDGCHLVKLDIQTGRMEICLLQDGLRATLDIMCDENQVPCLLQTHYEEIGGQRVSQNGIRYHYLDDIDVGNAYYWKYKWQHKGFTIADAFLDSTELILTKDLYVYEPKSGKIYFLLENDPNWEKPRLDSNGCWFDETKKYLSLMYNNVNVVIDWEARKMVARYVGKFKRGCLIDNEYWIFSEDELRRMPFPLIEDVPPEKLTVW